MKVEMKVEMKVKDFRIRANMKGQGIYIRRNHY